NSTRATSTSSAADGRNTPASPRSVTANPTTSPPTASTRRRRDPTPATRIENQPPPARGPPETRPRPGATQGRRHLRTDRTAGRLLRPLQGLRGGAEGAPRRHDRRRRRGARARAPAARRDADGPVRKGQGPRRADRERHAAEHGPPQQLHRAERVP